MGYVLLMINDFFGFYIIMFVFFLNLSDFCINLLNSLLVMNFGFFKLVLCVIEVEIINCCEYY